MNATDLEMTINAAWDDRDEVNASATRHGRGCC